MLFALMLGFDVHLMVHLMGLYGIPIPEFDVSCAMEYYSQFIGEWSRVKGRIIDGNDFPNSHMDRHMTPLSTVNPPCSF